MSSIIQLGEHNWRLPIAPTKQDDVFFTREKKDNQFWRRQTDFPKFFYDWDSETRLFGEYTVYGPSGDLLSLDRQNSKELLWYRDRELMRRCLGVWFMNNGELTYLTGGHYFFLQWCQMAGGNEENGSSYGNYREFQANLGYFLQMCKEDDECIGAYILKPKKTGVTQFIASDYVEESTRMRGKWFGMMSKAQVPDCRDTNFMMYKHCFENLPSIMKPSIANENLTMMFFGNPVNNKNNSRKTRARQNGNLEWLNTRVSCLPTKANAFDGGKPYRAWTDELPKCEDPYPEEIIKKTSPTVKMQRRVTGKWWASSYNPETDNKGYEQCKKFFYESMLDTRSKDTKRTKSEMYAYFINVLDSAEGSFDKFGKTDRAGNMVWIGQQLAQKKGDKDAIQSFQRANPTSIEEAWRSGGAGGSVFNNARLSAKRLTITQEQARGILRYKECNLSWTGQKWFSSVAITELTEEEKLLNKYGLWRMYGMADWPMDFLNVPPVKKLRDNDGLLMPDENVKFVIGMDPTNYSDGKDVIAGSKNAMWVFQLPDPVWNLARGNKVVSNRLIAEYYIRHDKPSDTLDDIIKAIMLWGCPIVIEGNMPVWVNLLIEKGFQNFLLVRDFATKAIVPYDPAIHKTLISTQKGSDVSINDLLSVAQEYIGEPEPGAFDNLDNVDSEILLQQLQDIDPKNTKKFDSAMAFFYVLFAAKCIDALLRRLLEKKHDYAKENFENIFEFLQEY